jgi:hypothetical protein
VDGALAEENRKLAYSTKKALFFALAMKRAFFFETFKIPKG